MEASAVVMITLVGGFAVLGILWKERDANIRYRKKANLIRSVFLGGSSDQKINDYLTKHKDLGILVPGDAEEPKGIGSTLKLMFFFLGLEILGLVVTFVYIWAKYYGYVPA